MKVLSISFIKTLIGNEHVARLPIATNKDYKTASKAKMSERTQQLLAGWCWVRFPSYRSSWWFVRRHGVYGIMTENLLEWWSNHIKPTVEEVMRWKGIDNQTINISMAPTLFNVFLSFVQRQITLIILKLYELINIINSFIHFPNNKIGKMPRPCGKTAFLFLNRFLNLGRPKFVIPATGTVSFHWLTLYVEYPFYMAEFEGLSATHLFEPLQQ